MVIGNAERVAITLVDDDPKTPVLRCVVHKTKCIRDRSDLDVVPCGPFRACRFQAQEAVGPSIKSLEFCGTDLVANRATSMRWDVALAAPARDDDRQWLPLMPFTLPSRTESFDV
ncbi:hypothetical protein Pla52o_14150 [Novipirellula galeiformis]|uniref:Uncharacterized protein n=1 Tax=Novipirellula galeiformis TaxID=2528004 RepID=A0A5C6CNC9_9BACT|nr:hypothetical protein Pla52o_14150 [Novipirellula galeiformis]